MTGERNGYDDAIEARNNCLRAMSETDCVDTRTSLWRASLRYGQLAREKVGERTAGEMAAPSPFAAGGNGECW
jgi:hypothetical protein